MARWRVDIIGKYPQYMGMVEADDARSALQEAIKLLNIRPALRSKIVVTNVTSAPRFPNGAN